MPRELASKEPARLHVRINGLVQGVNFRWFVQRRAVDMGICGWVRNRPDGSVEFVAEGERGWLENLLESVRIGPSSAVVESVDAQWEPPTREFGRFEIRH